VKGNVVIASRKVKKIAKQALKKSGVKALEDYPKASGSEKRNNPPGNMGGHA
jgi:hypothetical protein